MTTPILATLFDERYLARGLALIRSLQRWHPDFRLFVLALDEASYRAVLALNDERVPALQFHRHLYHDTPLGVALEGRTIAEKCYTLTPTFTRAIMQSFSIPHLTYCDADSYLFGNLDPFYTEIGDASVAIIPHRFPPRMVWREKENGTYNVNCVYFRNDEIGRRALEDWSAQCLAWCYNRTEHTPDGTLLFADQSYLDAFPAKYGAHIVKNIGINLAPWSQDQYDYTFDHGNLFVIAKTAERVTAIEKVRLYHFHGESVSFANPRRPEINRGGHPLKPEIIEHLYRPYEKELAEIHAELERNNY